MSPRNTAAPPGQRSTSLRRPVPTATTPLCTNSCATDLNATVFFKPTSTGGSGIVVPFKKSTFNRNQYGVNFGGPILHDRLFFFLDYEGFRRVLKPLSLLTLPTLNELNGVLVSTVRNPLTGTVYPAGTPIPQSAINPLSAQIISASARSPACRLQAPPALARAV